jgi:ABC-type nitrate/sulfonate/bicarbonate transport system permease component
MTAPRTMTATAQSAPPGTELSLTLTGKRGTRRFTTLGRRLNRLIGIAVLVVLWEGAPRMGLLDPKAFPPLSAVLAELGQLALTSNFWGYVANTTRTWAVGVVVASVSAIVVGLLIGLVPGAKKYTHSLIEFLRPIPSVALIPAVILIFGTKYQSGVVLITYAAFWPLLLQVLFGLDDIDTVAKDTAKTFRFRRVGYIRSVVWPSLLPHLFIGLRLAASTALVLAVTGELVIGTVGIGQGIAIAQTSGSVPTMYALVVVAGIMGVFINIVARVVERRALWWHASVRNLTGKG